MLAVLHVAKGSMKRSHVALLIFQETESITGIVHRVESRGWSIVCRIRTTGAPATSSRPSTDDIGTQLLFCSWAATYERRSLGVASHWPFDQWGHFLPQQGTAVSLLDRLLHHAVIVVTDGESFRIKEARSRSGLRTLS